MRRLSPVTIAAIPVLLGLVGNMATGTVQISNSGQLWVWAAAVLLTIAAVMNEVRRGRPGQPALDE